MELTGGDVTECVGGGEALDEHALQHRYESVRHRGSTAPSRSSWPSSRRCCARARTDPVPDAGVIDLRSDTVTVPSPEMRARWPTPRSATTCTPRTPPCWRFEEKVADIFGFEAGSSPSPGRLANLLAVRGLVGVGEEVLCESSAHIARAEMGAHGAFTGLTMRTWTDVDGYVDLDAIEALIAPDLGLFFVRTTCVSAENTTPRGRQGAAGRAARRAPGAGRPARRSGPRRRGTGLERPRRRRGPAATSRRRRRTRWESVSARDWARRSGH